MDIKNIQKLTVDFYANKINFVRAKQYDKQSRYLLISCTNNGVPVKFNAEDTDCYLKMYTASNRALLYQETINEDGTILVEFTEDMLCDAGKSRFELNMMSKDGNKMLSTMAIDVMIEPSVYGNDVAEATEEFGALTKIIIDGKKLIFDLETLETLLEEKEAERQQNETDRQTNEGTRENNEDIRRRNESKRETAETKRQTDTAEAISNTNIATDNANQATQNANNATELANQATQNADDATSRANTAIEIMNRLIADDNLVHKDMMGVANGVASLDENGTVPASQLPAFVDDVLEGEAQGIVVDPDTGSQTATGFILTGETEECTPEKDKIYVDVNRNVTYRWGGTVYVTIGSSLTLGTTSSTAFPGDRGLALEQMIEGNLTAEKIQFDNSTTSLLSANVQDAIEELTETATVTKAGLMSAGDKQRVDNYANVQEIEVVLAASDWSPTTPSTQTIAVNLTNYNNCSIVLSETSTATHSRMIADANITSIVYDETQGLTFTIDGIVPTSNIPLTLIVGTSLNVVEAPKYLGSTKSGEGAGTAAELYYDDTLTRLGSDNVQGAIEIIDTYLDETPSLSSVIEETAIFAPRDADVVGGKYTVEDIDNLVAENNQLKARVEELNNSLGNKDELVLLGMANNTNPISMNLEKYKSIVLELYANGTYSYMEIPKSVLQASAKRFMISQYYDQSNYISEQLDITLSSFIIAEYKVSGFTSFAVNIYGRY